jgi:hypothetical protein
LVVKARSLIRGFCARHPNQHGKVFAKKRLTAGQAHLLDADFGEDAGQLADLFEAQQFFAR